jgi:ribosomal protein L6P/L9E
MERKINLNDFKKVSLVKLKSKVYFVVENKIFIEIPAFVILQSENGFLRFYLKETNISNDYTSFFNLLDNIRQLLSSSFRSKIMLKGLGYKCVVNKDVNTLSLKVGFSHPVEINLTDDIKAVNVFKENILIESKDKIALGNFIHKLYITKPINAYKEKGFILSSKKIKLKEIKKK